MQPVQPVFTSLSLSAPVNTTIFIQMYQMNQFWNLRQDKSDVWSDIKVGENIKPFFLQMVYKRIYATQLQLQGQIS